MAGNTKRPVYLNLLRIRMPAAAVASFAHRVSGVLLVLSLPFFVYLFDRSLAGPESFEQVLGMLQSVPVKLLLLPLGWSIAHHFLAGIRFLLIDLDIGVSREAARIGAWSVNLGGLLVLLLLLIGGIL